MLATSAPAHKTTSQSQVDLDGSVLFWSIPPPELIQQLDTSGKGLSAHAAMERLGKYGPNRLKPAARSHTLLLLVGQFKSPIILILLFAATLAFFVGERTDAVIIFLIVLVSGLLGFWQEHGANDAVNKLLALVELKASVLRDGHAVNLPVESIVPGDIVLLSAGSHVPGDGLILESTDLYVDEALLTGETFPVDKSPGLLAEDVPLAHRTNAVFMGTHVVSGSAQVVIVHTGAMTECGLVSQHLQSKPTETEFERGIRRFGYMLLEVTFALVIVIFAVNVYLRRPVIDSFLFALAIAVGLTPQLLPVIISINLARGAKRMARDKVIVKRLAAIENFGSMNILCSDKTGTLTEGVARLQGALDVAGNESEKVFSYAYLNAYFESGFANPIDEAIRSSRTVDVEAYRKLSEVPYDFIRKRLSIVVRTPDDKTLLIVKGALSNVLDVCATVDGPQGQVAIEIRREQIAARFEQLSDQGLRTLGVAYRALTTQEIDNASHMAKDNERDLIFLGFITLSDPPKAGAMDTIKELNGLGIAVKIITGDNSLVAKNLGNAIGLPQVRMLSGPELRHLSDHALRQRAGQVDVFAEIEPNQKERIILALRKAGNVVGYIGDGINDASALHAADVGISVGSAVDVAKEAAEIVLLEKNLRVLAQGVREGRTTFANTLKYVFMATSANFGNMFSMAGASLFLPFLPLLPKQVLLTNLLTDLPEMTIATDSVDAEWSQRPRRWDIGYIGRFMLVFGALSSVFDYLTFGVLRLLLHADQTEFHSGWFVESVLSASLIVLVVRTRRPFFASRPSRYLLGATLGVVVLTLLLPFTQLGHLFGFAPLPPAYLGTVALLIVLYIGAAEFAKRAFYWYQS